MAWRWSTSARGLQRLRRLGLGLGLVAALLLGGCGEAGPPGPPPPDLGPPVLVLVNQGTGDDRPLEQAMLHSSPENYRGRENLLQRPLQPGEQIERSGLAPGQYHLTVIRKKLSLPVSDLVALTTAKPLDLRTGRVEVWVFDESFRVFSPRPSTDGGPQPPADAGPPDALDAGLDADADASGADADGAALEAGADSAVDADASIGDAGSSACIGSAPAQQLAANMIVCSTASTGKTQCEAPQLCNTTEGWHLCTASEYLARGGQVSGTTPAAQGWIASCVVDDDGDATLPTDGVCSVCTGSSAGTPPHPTVSWACSGGNPLTSSARSAGVLTSSACRKLGPIEGTAVQGYWDVASAFLLMPGAVCCQ